MSEGNNQLTVNNKGTNDLRIDSNAREDTTAIIRKYTDGQLSNGEYAH